MGHLTYEQESWQINSAVFEVHKILGPGLNEKIYQEALAVELAKCGIPFEREKRFKVKYKDVLLNTDYIADFVCFNSIIVELKAVSEILDIHRAQVNNYLNITKYKLGLLYNMNSKYIRPERILNSN